MTIPIFCPLQPNSSYSGYYLMQDISQDDAFLRVTWRPLNNLTLVTRYDFERTNISNHVQGATSGSAPS